MLDLVTSTLVNHIVGHTLDLTDDAQHPWVVAGALDGDATPATDKLTVALVSVEEHPHLRNRPLTRTDAGYVRPPLALHLLYVLTYLANTATEVQSRLARVAQVFHTFPILGPDRLDAAIRDQVELLVVRMHNPGTDERSQLWTALGRPMPLALYYEVDVAYIPVLVADGAGIVEQARIDYGVLV